jgi:streptomycin 6-kinase
MIATPEAFARGTVAREGEHGEWWLATLPELMTELVERWDCVEDGPVMHGEVGVIVPVLQAGRRGAEGFVPAPGQRLGAVRVRGLARRRRRAAVRARA